MKFRNARISVRRTELAATTNRETYATRRGSCLNALSSSRVLLSSRAPRITLTNAHTTNAAMAPWM